MAFEKSSFLGLSMNVLTQSKGDKLESWDRR